MLAVVKRSKLCQKLVIRALFSRLPTGQPYLELLLMMMKLPQHEPKTSPQTKPTSYARVIRPEITARLLNCTANDVETSNGPTCAPNKHQKIKSTLCPL